MDKINKKTLKVLKFIKKNANVDEYKLKIKFPESERYSDKLEELGYIENHNPQDPNKDNGYLMDAYSITDDGLFYIENYQDEKYLTLKEKWIERIVGALFAILVAAICYMLGII